MKNKKGMKSELQTAFRTRQYMLSRDFEIYYYSDYKYVPLHTHDYYEFYFFLEGDVTITVDKKEYSIKHGDFLLIPPNTKHHISSIDNVSPYRRFVLWISQDYCNRLLEASNSYVYLMQYVATTHNYLFENDMISFNTIQSMIFQLIEEIKSEHFGKEAQISLHINSLLLHLNRLVYSKNHLSPAHAEKDLYLLLCNYIGDHLEEDLSLDNLETVFYASKFYISHTFKDNMGISLHQYITKKRLHASKDAILSNIPISKVYGQYGFCDYSSFFRAFKKEYGLSPKEYKNMYGTL